MINSYAIPKAVSPFFDFHIAEELLKRGVNSRLIKIINDGLVSGDNSARAALIEANQIYLLINEGGNSYETSVNAMESFVGNKSGDAFVLPVKDDGLFLGMVIPEKQTVLSKTGIFDGRYGYTYSKAVNWLKSRNKIPIFEFEDLFPSEWLFSNIASVYDSHLTNHASMLIFTSILKKLNVKCSLEGIKWHEKIVYPDLLQKFTAGEFRMPWISDGDLIYETKADPGRNRGMVRRFRKDDAAIKASIVFFGDSHSYSGLVPIASQLFSETLFVWSSPFDISEYASEIDAFKADFTIYEISERFLYAKILQHP